uniref:Uncharacterized protein n=1 Tax=Pyramimonas orientalis virus TaxID=455367 RepID=A0A7M3UNZ3_POV01|nr:hypothetical protein HWQ62_00306 [Pyramimonas orientalis virus]
MRFVAVLLVIGVIFLIATLILTMKQKLQMTETFNDVQRQLKFFVLQHDKRNNITYTINNINNCTRVGYLDESHKDIFENIYKMTNNDDSSMRFNYIKLINPRIEDVDILLYVNDAIYLKDYKIINYFTNDLYMRQKYFRYSKFVVYNDTGTSTMVLLLNGGSQNVFDSTNNVFLEQKESVSSEYNFVIEHNINGNYHEADLTTNIIILYQNKLANLEVRVGDTILMKNQSHTFINGVYVVTKVNNFIHMKRENIKLLPANEVCIDENLTELPEYTNKYSCEHANDAFGNKKITNATWDARCQRNIQCPFYNDNGQYLGNCEPGGMCMMPHNVKQISFTKYKTY